MPANSIGKDSEELVDYTNIYCVVHRTIETFLWRIPNCSNGQSQVYSCLYSTAKIVHCPVVYCMCLHPVFVMLE